MIYVLKSSGFDESENLIKLIKIGYTDNWDKRLLQYKLHNPTIKVLYKIEDGNEDDEKFLHSYFSKHKLKDYGREWFYYNDEIISFFNSYKTIEEIRGLDEYYVEIPTDDVIKELSKTRSEILIYINRVSFTISKDIRKRLEFVNKYRSYQFLINNKIGNVDKLFEFINSEYKLNLIKKDFDFKKTKDIVEFLKDYNELPNLYSKLKYLCEYISNNFSAGNLVLEHIAEKHFKEYVLTLGLERCKSLSYKVDKLNKELGIITFNQNNLQTVIYNNFNIGDKLSRDEIKNKLISLYNQVGYNKSPKAIDLSIWFELKEILLAEAGKKSRVRGFQIIKKKG